MMRIGFYPQIKRMMRIGFYPQIKRMMRIGIKRIFRFRMFGYPDPASKRHSNIQNSNPLTFLRPVGPASLVLPNPSSPFLQSLHPCTG
jgi:hypothetical protein